MTLIHRRLQPVRTRQQLLWLAQCAAWGLLVGAVSSFVYGGTQLILGHVVSLASLLGFILAGPVLGALFSAVRGRNFRQAAAAVDAYYGLKDRATTALDFVDRPDSCDVHRLQLADAEQHLAKVDPKAVAPWKMPRTIPWAAAMTAASFALLAVSVPSATVDAALTVNSVVIAQAQRAAEQIEILKEQNEEEPSAEMEQLIKELSAKVEEMQQPGVDAKEALAKLSEMQSALQEQQQQLESASTDGAMQVIGDALSNAQPLAAAGSSLSAGNYSKATEELGKLDEIPMLDRQTQKSVTEKLDNANEKIDAVKLKNLAEAVDNLSQGLGSGDGKAFSEGVKGLAVEAKKQGRRKKLKDLLRKQSDMLGEAKGEVEGEFRGSGKGGGGNNWGLGGAEKELGDKTASLGSPRQLQMAGQEGNQGDVETESTHFTDGREQAQRGYREKFDKSQKLNDSVLDSEPIPLGHRQTIRRYFEMIRPQRSEVDQIKEKTEAKETE